MTVHSFVARSAEPAFPLAVVANMSQRLSNEYAEAISALVLAAAETSDPRARDALWRTATQLRTQAATHEALQPPATDAATNLGDYLGQVCACLSSALLGQRGVRLALETDELWIPASRAWRIGVIISELVRDAARRRRSDDRRPIAIRLSADRGQVNCVLCDMGAEGPANLAGARRLVSSLAAELGASLEAWQTSKASVVHLQVSAATPAAA